ncbi:response regulator [Spirosoma luteum]|uniref:response regulator n=1 Tax=Spirosoma luteum TaxID=431553 RepID=UPI0003718632
MEKILIIDDNNDICLLLERFLSKQGYKTVSVQRGDDGLVLLRKEAFELVICDFKLPDINGLEMLRRIKVMHPSTAVIIITGYSDVRMAVQTVKHGAYDYVTKPLYPDEILYTIKAALERRSQSLNQGKDTAGAAKGHPARSPAGKAALTSDQWFVNFRRVKRRVSFGSLTSKA